MLADQDVWKKDGNLRANYIGEVENAAYDSFVRAIGTVDEVDMENLMSGGDKEGGCGAGISTLKVLDYRRHPSKDNS